VHAHPTGDPDADCGDLPVRPRVPARDPDAGAPRHAAGRDAEFGADGDDGGLEAPDVIDVGLSFGPTAQAAGLLQPYKVSTWASIPDSAKEKDGYWYGDYYGVLSFQVNTDMIDKVPTDWPDLLKPDYKNAVALAGDPRSSGGDALACQLAGLSREYYPANFFQEIPDISSMAQLVKFTTEIAELQQAVPAFL